MRTNIILVMMIAFMLVVQVSAALPAQPQEKKNFEKLQNAMLLSIDKKLEELEKLKIRVDNARVDQEDKELIKSDLDKVIPELKVYKTKIEAANSTEELIAIRKQANQHIKENKETIKKAIKELKKAFNDEIAEKAKNLTIKIDVKLEALKNECPGQKEEITALQKNASKVKSEVQTLNKLIDADQPDQALIAAQVKKISKMVSALVPQIQSIAKTCMPSVSEKTSSKG